MTLPTSSVVDVKISIAPIAPPAPGFGIAAIVSDDLDLGGVEVPSLRVTAFNSITEVAAVYPIASATYIQASAYFLQTPRPDELAVIAQHIVNSPGSLFGLNGTDTDVSPWNAINLGEFNIVIDGLATDIVGLDFSGAIDMDAVAAIIQTGIQAIGTGGYTLATCVWNTPLARLEITTGQDGDTLNYLTPAVSPVSFQDVSDISRMTQTWASALIQGTTIETPVQALTAAEIFNNSFYGVLLLAKHRDTQVSIDVANWTEARIKIYSLATNNPNTIIPGNTSHQAYAIWNSNLTRTIVSYSSTPNQYPDAAVLGEAFTTNFDVPNSVSTLKFKIFEGITPEDLTSSQKSALDTVRANASVSVGKTSMFAEGTLSSQLFFDERHSIDWLQGQIETNVFNYLSTRLTKVPLTDAGGASLEQQVIRALDKAVSNGMLAPGTDSNGNFLGNGYVTNVQAVSDMSPTDKANRQAPIITFTALLGTPVHFVTVAGIVER